MSLTSTWPGQHFELFVPVDCLGNCMTCGRYVQSTGGCVPCRPTVFNVPGIEPSVQTTTAPEFEIVWVNPNPICG